MPNGRAISAAPETVLARSGTTARFDGARVRIVRRRTTWRLPVRAIGSVALTATGAVRIEISGMSGSARHGLGSAVELPTPNTHAAKAFFGQLTAALAAVEPAADGHALVQVETVPRQSPQPGARGRQVVAIALLLVLYTLLLVALGQVSPRKAGTAALSLSVGGVLGLAAGFTLWRMGRRIRSLWLLRRRGILAAETVGSQVELRYDPEHPDRASRPLTVGFAFRALLVAAVALVPGAAFALCVLVNLPV